MASKANFLETAKGAIPTGGIAPVVAVYFTWEATSAGAAAVYDLNGNAVNMDFDGIVVGFAITCAVSGGAGTIALQVNGTDVVGLGSMSADSCVATLSLGFDASAAVFTAGSAAVTMTSSNNTKSGRGVLYCVAT